VIDPRPTPKRRVDALTKFLADLDEIERAVMRRDALAITALLRKRTATHLPREVREELLLLSRASRDNLRAPVRFLRFQYRMTELAKGGERLPTAQTELPLDPRSTAGIIRLRPNDGRRAAALGDASGRDGDDSGGGFEPGDPA
jgi:hypothetical protein